jgi:MobC-like protein
MRKGETKGAKRLDSVVLTRINKTKYDQLQLLASKTKDETVSGIVRNILHNRPIKVYSHDETVDLLLEELAALRGEIKAIGVNINQITRLFNTYKEDQKKEFFAKIGLKQYLRMEDKIDQALALISKLAKVWLSK